MGEGQVAFLLRGSDCGNFSAGLLLLRACVSACPVAHFGWWTDGDSIWQYIWHGTSGAPKLVLGTPPTLTSTWAFLSRPPKHMLALEQPSISSTCLSSSGVCPSSLCGSGVLWPSFPASPLATQAA